jgi:hypothetical protein
MCSTAQKISKLILIVIDYAVRVICHKKDSAEEYPKNFSILRLAEKT